MPPYNATDPTATFLSSSCLDLLMIELVPMAYRVTNELDAASASNPNLPPPAAAGQHQQQQAQPSSADSVSAAGTTGTVPPPGAGARRVMDEEEERDAVFYRLEMLGYRVGQGLVERYVLFPRPWGSSIFWAQRRPCLGSFLLEDRRERRKSAHARQSSRRSRQAEDWFTS